MKAAVKIHKINFYFNSIKMKLKITGAKITNINKIENDYHE